MIPAIILAKGDSNRIPHKNMKDFCGHPLVYWTIKQAMGSKLTDLVVVSTDSPEIKEFAQHLGCVTVDRPYELTLTVANHAVIHALNSLRDDGVEIDYFTTPLPTSPCRLPQDMDNLIATTMINQHNTATCIAEQLETIVYETKGLFVKNLIWAKNHEYYIDGGGMSCNRAEWYRDLAQYTPWTDAEADVKFATEGIQYDSGYCVIKEWQTVELDLPEHWGMAEAVMRHYILDPLGKNCWEEYKHGKES